MHEKSAETARPNRNSFKCVKLNAKRWGNFWGCPEDSYPISTLAQRHSSKELILWPPSGGPPHTAVVAMWGGNRTWR